MACLRYYTSISMEVQRKPTETSGRSASLSQLRPVPHIDRRVATHRENFRADLMVAVMLLVVE